MLGIENLSTNTILMSSETFEAAFVSPLTGNVFQYTSEDEEGVNSINEIAHGLAGTNRYNALTEPYVNVAQHSLYSMKLQEQKGHSPYICLGTLLHDADEIRTGDLPHPLKEVKVSDIDLKSFLDLDLIDRDYITKETEDMDFLAERYTDEELLDIFQTIGGSMGITLGDFLDPIDERAENSLYSDFGLQPPNEVQEELIKEADVEAAAYEVEFLMSEENRQSILDEWEDEYTEWVNSYREDIEEKPGWMNFSESAEESRQKFISDFEDLIDRV